jgi:hypothetical protein
MAPSTDGSSVVGADKQRRWNGPVNGEYNRFQDGGLPARLSSAHNADRHTVTRTAPRLAAVAEK